MWSEDEADDGEAKPSLGSFDCMADQSKAWQRRGEFGPAQTPSKTTPTTKTATRFRAKLGAVYKVVDA
jgi:hypothetical protein